MAFTDAFWLLPLFADALTRCAVQTATSARTQLEVGLTAGDAGAPLCVAPPAAGLLVAVPPDADAEFDTLPPGPFGVPSPSVPAPPVGCEPPVSTVLLAWMMAATAARTSAAPHAASDHPRQAVRYASTA